MLEGDVPVAIIALGKILKFHHIYGHIVWTKYQTVIVFLHMAPEQVDDTLELVLHFIFAFFQMSTEANLPVQEYEDNLYITIHPSLKLTPAYITNFLNVD